MVPEKKIVTVLLADDDPGDQSRMQLALQGVDASIKVDLLQNGMQVLEHLLKITSTKGKKKQPLPDIIITDLYMPFAGGLHVLKQIRLREAFRHIPIYVFSANNDNTIRTQVLANGATEFHQKPCDFNELQNIVGGILNKCQAAAA